MEKTKEDVSKKKLLKCSESELLMFRFNLDRKPRSDVEQYLVLVQIKSVEDICVFNE